MAGKDLRAPYRTYSEQQVLKISAQLEKSLTKYLFPKAKITRFAKTSFKQVTEIVKLELNYLKLRFEFPENQTLNFFQKFRLSPILSCLSVSMTPQSLSLFSLSTIQ